jgi:AraC family transcriptional regulator of adaptative response/methylated-DNA-[protein]-cysteine methyltransferase
MNTILQVAANSLPPRTTIIDRERAWKQLLARDRAAEFIYAVTTTGVFCRPWCASKRPLAANVRFFASTEAARTAGYRACKRCKPDANEQISAMDRVRAHIESHLERAVPLKELARVAGLSPFTVQRLFKKQLGASPLQYQRALRSGRLRRELKQGGTVTDAIYEAGFGSSSRAYEGSGLGMTPARFAQGGRGEQIGFAAAASAFGWIVVGATERGLCWLSLAGSKAEAERSLREEFPLAGIAEDPALKAIVDAALRAVGGEQAGKASDGKAGAGGEEEPALDLRGTAFQLRVWQALRAIPRGETRTYGQLAREMGMPNSTRAVARACAMNRVSMVVPCHRVVGASGSLTGYRWGVERKRQLLEAERG